MKYVTKLKYDEKPDYEKCRKIFVDGLKSLGKPNSGDLDFKVSSAASTPAKKSAVVKSPVKEQRAKPGRPRAVAVAKPLDNVENISPKVKNSSPKVKNSRKRDPSLNDSSEDSASPSKKVRQSNKATTQVRATKVSSRTTATTTTSKTNSSVVVNDGGRDEKGKRNKTYNINLDLDISFDAEVIVNVKRKKKKSPKEAVESPNQSIQSTDEIPPSDKSFIVTKVYKRAPRESPRAK